MADNYYSANMDMHFKKNQICYKIYGVFFGDFIAAFIFYEAASYAAAKLPSLAKVCGTVLQMTFL